MSFRIILVLKELVMTGKPLKTLPSRRAFRHKRLLAALQLPISGTHVCVDAQLEVSQLTVIIGLNLEWYARSDKAPAGIKKP